MRIVCFALALVTSLAFPAVADPLKNESGKFMDRAEARETTGRAARQIEIPKGHLPPPGECRVWARGVPAGQQPPPYKC